MSHEDDGDRVMGLLAEIGHPLVADKIYGRLVPKPPQVLGVEALADSRSASACWQERSR